MVRETKNIITKEIIAKDLQDENKKSFPILLIVSLVYTLVVSGVLLAIYFLGLKNGEAGTISYVIFLVGVFICLLPLFFFIALLIAGRKTENSANFFVITDEVVWKEEKTVTRPRAALIKKVIHFSRCGSIEVNSTYYQTAAEHDVFYMVVRNQDSKNALKCYPAKLYEYIE